MIYYEKTDFLKELMLIKQMNQKSDFFHYWYFLDRSFNFQTYVGNS